MANADEGIKKMYLSTFSVVDDRIEYISDVLQTLIIDERSAAVLKPNFGKQEQNQYILTCYCKSASSDGDDINSVQS